jgi:hypothetical protein
VRADHPRQNFKCNDALKDKQITRAWARRLREINEIVIATAPAEIRIIPVKGMTGCPWGSGLSHVDHGSIPPRIETGPKRNVKFSLRLSLLTLLSRPDNVSSQLTGLSPVRAGEARCPRIKKLTVIF